MLTSSGGPLAARPSLLVIETGLSLAVFLVALCWPRLGFRWFESAESALSKLAAKRGLAILTVTLLAVLLRLAILPLVPIPQPFVHDEFSFLLAADTFASGRLANPTHPLWPFFESFHIELLPTYMSMYFPGQGLVMAAGKVLFGHPWYGVLASAAIMCGAICWMLQGWLPPGWALFGAMLAVLRLGLFSYWINSYYGGAVAAIGGALVLGALPRVLRSLRVQDGSLMAIGMVILANTRPWEGMLICAPVTLILIWTFTRSHRAGLFVRRMALPVALLIAGGGLTGYYNFRAFGNPLTLPYQVNRASYAVAPFFVWMKPRPEPKYRHKEFHDFYINWELRDFNRARTPDGFLSNTATKLAVFLFFFCGVALLPPLLAARRVIRDRRLRWLTIIAAILGIGLSVNAWFFPHYAAPFAGAFYAVLVQGYRHLRQWRPSGQPCGLLLTRAAPVLCIALAVIRTCAAPLDLRIDRFPTMWYGTAPLGLARATVQNKLSHRCGGQLAIVRYSYSHSSLDDWVYNSADIDRSKVVWAREMDPVSNARLLNYFCNRQAWLVEPDANPPRISPYPARLR